jgi:phospholipid/cholesterol/gamma-HCH transport system ATP-binding protein
MAATPVVDLRNVWVFFEEKAVLADVSLSLEPGGTLALLGVTGAGKSVLLKVILGLIKPDAGEVWVEGHNLTPLSDAELAPYRRRMGMVFQEGALFDSLSVFENVAYSLREEGLRDQAAIEQRVREVLGFVEMEHAVEKMPSELSGGMRRRVAIARAIVSQPCLMLYDSATAGLDPVTSHTINVLLAKLRDLNSVTTVFVTHRLQDAFTLSNYLYSPKTQDLVPAVSDGDRPPHVHCRFLILRDGKVYFQGTSPEFARSEDPYLRKFLA